MQTVISRPTRVRGTALLLLLAAALSGCGETFSVTLIPTGDEGCYQEDTIVTDCRTEEVVEEQCFEQDIIIEECTEVFGILICTEEPGVEVVCQDVVIDVVEVCEDVVVDSVIICE
jgi:hypothetical protein